MGVPNEIHPERISPMGEQFLEKVRFGQRGKLVELLDELVRG